MSVSVFIALRDDRLPTADQWQQAIDDLGVGLQLESIDNLRSHTGYLSARMGDEASGFEWSYGPAGDMLGDGFELPADLDHVAVFVTHSDIRELVCSMLAAGCLAQCADGLFFDEDADAFVPGATCIETARRILQDEEERRRRLAAEDAAITDQRCPACGAPCPSYRKSCKVCGAEVGRRD